MHPRRSPDPFRYPDQLLIRKHGPAGYSKHGPYRDWLRDEFRFRCVFCLMREQWSPVKGSYDIDHFQPQMLRPDLVTEYSNLLYACHTCNLGKSSRLVPDPARCIYGECLGVDDDGSVYPLDENGEILIDELDLDATSRVAFRKLWLDIIRMAVESGNQSCLTRALGLPDDLPDLASLRPPGGNMRAGGVKHSWRSIRDSGMAPLLLE